MLLLVALVGKPLTFELVCRLKDLIAILFLNSEPFSIHPEHKPLVGSLPGTVCRHVGESVVDCLKHLIGLAVQQRGSQMVKQALDAQAGLRQLDLVLLNTHDDDFEALDHVFTPAGAELGVAIPAEPISAQSLAELDDLFSEENNQSNACCNQ